jgi:hypothetical protein
MGHTKFITPPATAEISDLARNSRAHTGLGAPWNGPRKTRDHALSRLQFVLINKGNDGATSGAEMSSA